MSGQEAPAAGVKRPSAARRFLLAAGHFFFRARNALFPVIFALLMLVTRPAEFLGRADLDRWVIVLGVATALLGQAFRMLVIGYAYIRRGGKGKRIYADDLVTAGIYAHSRNPMYVGNMLIACGVGVVYGSPWVYAAVIPFFLFVYGSIVVAEEDYLLGKYGEAYVAYMRDVNRFIPDVRGLRQTLAGYRFRWRTVLSKEYGTIFGTLAGLLVVTGYKRVWVYGYEASKPALRVLALLAVPCVVFYVTARALKLTGRLKEPAAA